LIGRANDRQLNLGVPFGSVDLRNESREFADAGAVLRAVHERIASEVTAVFKDKKPVQEFGGRVFRQDPLLQHYPHIVRGEPHKATPAR
jgi:hypothetical protein